MRKMTGLIMVVCHLFPILGDFVFCNVLHFATTGKTFLSFAGGFLIRNELIDDKFSINLTISAWGFDHRKNMS